MSFIHLSEITTHRLGMLLIVLLQGLLLPPAWGNGPATPYIDETQLTQFTWPYRSHWLQPWRAYLETVPASTFLNGIGVNLDNENPALVAQMLAKVGVRNARLEIPWGVFE